MALPRPKFQPGMVRKRNDCPLASRWRIGDLNYHIVSTLLRARVESEHGVWRFRKEQWDGVLIVPVWSKMWPLTKLVSFVFLGGMLKNIS